MANPAVIDICKHHYLFMPVLNTLTLGIYGMVAPPASPTDSTADSTAESTEEAAVIATVS